MKSIQIQLTGKCNQLCYMCGQHDWVEKPNLSLDKVLEYIDKYPNCTFTFTGGDPLSWNINNYEDMKKLTDYLIKNKISYQIFTNLYFNLNEAQLYFLKNAEVVQISFDGSTYKRYKYIRGVGNKKGYDNLISNIKSLTNYTDIKLNCTVSLRNFDDVYNILNIAKKLKVKIRFFPVHTKDNIMLNDKMFKSIKKQFEEFKLKNIDFVKDKTNIESFEFEPRKPFNGKCYVKNEHLVIMADGLEYPCCRATNDNGENWNGKYNIQNLDNLDDPDILYEFCSNCDRYRKFNDNWDEYKNKEKVYL